MLAKRNISIRWGDGFLDAEVDALDFSDMPASIKACLDGAANYRAMELASRMAADRIKALPAAVYVMAPNEMPVCKIGIAASPHDRLGELQCGNWHDLHVVALLWLDVAAYEVEQLALKAAKQMGIHLRGEWLAAEPVEACELILKAARHSRRPVFDSATWINNWPIRMNAVAEARGRAEVIGKLKPRGQKFSA